MRKILALLALLFLSETGHAACPSTAPGVGSIAYWGTASGAIRLECLAPGTSGLPLLSQGAAAPAYTALNLAGAAVTGTLPATKGGTDNASYAVGDILYANTTTSLARLADVATGNALISGGVGVAPSWGKIALTTHISGVLPVANGGTNCSAASGTCLDNITGLASLGIISRTGTGTYTPRTQTGTAGEITVTNGTGAGGDPTFSLPTALTFTGKTITGGTYASVVSSTYIAGTTSVAPINLTAGTNLTTATAGSVEYDGKAFYSTPSSAVRGVSPSVHFLSLSANQTGSDVATAQTWFPGGGATGFTLPATTSYFFEGMLIMTRSAGTTAHTISMLFGGTATITSIGYMSFANSGDAGAFNIGQTRQDYHNVATADNVWDVSSSNATEFNTFYITGIVRINGAGTFLPQIQYSAAPGGAPTMNANTWFRMYPIGTNTVLNAGAT